MLFQKLTRRRNILKFLTMFIIPSTMKIHCVLMLLTQYLFSVIFQPSSRAKTMIKKNQTYLSASTNPQASPEVTSRPKKSLLATQLTPPLAPTTLTVWMAVTFVHMSRTNCQASCVLSTPGLSYPRSLKRTKMYFNLKLYSKPPTTQKSLVMGSNNSSFN